MKGMKVIIGPKEISELTGWGLRKSQMVVKELKQYLHKRKNQLITIYEFSEYMAIDPDSFIRPAYTT